MNSTTQHRNDTAPTCKVKKGNFGYEKVIGGGGWGEGICPPPPRPLPVPAALLHLFTIKFVPLPGKLLDCFSFILFTLKQILLSTLKQRYVIIVHIRADKTVN